MIPVPIPPILNTKRCKLDRIILHDMDMLRDIVKDSQFRLFMPELCEVIHDVDGIYRFLRSFDTYAQKGEGFLWAIRKNTFLIGFVAIMDMSYDPTLFYAIHPKYRNKGYAKEVVAGVVEYYRSITKASLRTEVYMDNHASLVVLSSCGFHVTNRIDDKYSLALHTFYFFCTK